jgi:hypothetical protein
MPIGNSFGAAQGGDFYPQLVRDKARMRGVWMGIRAATKTKPGGKMIPAGPVETEMLSFGSLLLLLLRLLILLRQIRLRRIGRHAGTGLLIASQEWHKRRDFKRHFLAR